MRPASQADRPVGSGSMPSAGRRAGRASGSQESHGPSARRRNPPRPCTAPDGAHPRVLEEPLQHPRKRGPARIGAGALRRAAVEPGAAHELLHGGPPRPERVDSSVMQSLVCGSLRLATGSSAPPATHRGVRLARRFGASCPRTEDSPSHADPPIPVVAVRRGRRSGDTGALHRCPGVAACAREGCIEPTILRFPRYGSKFPHTFPEILAMVMPVGAGTTRREHFGAAGPEACPGVAATVDVGGL